MAERRAGAGPIVIFGVSQRSGTNFLANLLLCHEDCAAPAPPVFEGHLLAEAPRLVDYARATARRWPRRWGDRDEGEAALRRGLGSGLMSFLEDRVPEGKRPVVKTPSVENLDLYPVLFPEASVLLLVRDGRSVVESLHTGFRRSYTGAMKTWRAGARRIVGFVAEAPDRWPELTWRLVRYEDLVAEPEQSLRALLEFLDLDEAGFDFGAARDLPVFGSSFVSVEGGLTWEPVEKDTTFDPSERFAGWGPRLHDHFAWVAGREQRALDYAVEASTRPAVARTLGNALLELMTPFTKLRDVAMHTRWRLRSAVQRRSSPRD